MRAVVYRPRYWASSSPRISCSVKFLPPMERPDGLAEHPARSRADAERKRRRSILVANPPKTALKHSEQQIRAEGQQRGRNGSGQDHAVIDHGYTAKDELAQAARTDGGSNRRHPDGDDRCCANARYDY